ncbi:hypothetical protein LUZ63_022753 [Rhynchospora breviuscula]|uniref:Uncharacterized protein n=1 Tax=Rhynchospora breviuscula TaxID=2022672 RepID=A0A9P9Z5C6_9POAL|nr:hypothetical protein LUZ63_022753 [Rhynchospora breviuscula]
MAFHLAVLTPLAYQSSVQKPLDIEVPNDSVDKSSWESSACYPRRTFDPLSESPSTRDSRITMADFRLCSTSRSHSQAGLYHYAHEQNQRLSLPSHTSASLDERVVFQDWSLCVTTSHLSYTFDQGCHCEAIVKVHGVLPSSRWYSASSRRIQFHRVHVGDSGAVVTPFVQVATYATRNFATLGQLELLPPFTGGFHSKLRTLLLPTFQHRAGVRLYTSCYHLAESCVFNKQSLPPGMCRFPNQKKIGEHPFSRSYGFTGRIALPIRSFFLEVSTMTMTTVATDYEDPRDYGRAVRSALSRPLLVSKDSRPLRKMKKARTVYNEWLVNQSTRWSKTTSVHT